MAQENGDGVALFKEALIVLTVIVVGLSIGLAFQGISIFQLIQAVSTFAQPVWQPIQSAWLMLPEQWRGIIMAGVPGLLFTGFFAWAKMKWQDRAKQTQLQLTQLEGEKQAASRVINDQGKQILDLQNQPPSPDLKEALLDIKDLNLQIESKNNRIRDLEGRISALQKEIGELKMKILALEIRNKELATVA